MRITVVRPPDFALPDRLFALLRAVGAPVEWGGVHPAGTPDDALIAALRAEYADAVLLPYHPHKDRDGRRVNGLDLACRMDLELPTWRTTPILMPVSAFSTTFRIGLSRARAHARLTRRLEERLLVIEDHTLEDLSLAETIIEHVSAQQRSVAI